MPLYSYKCAACGAIFDERIPVQYSGSAASCPACGGPSSRLYGPPAILFHPTRSSVDARVREETESF